MQRLRKMLADFTRRRRFIVNPRLQLRLVFASLVSSAMCVMAIAASLFVPLVSELLTIDGTSERPEVSAAAESLLYLHGSFWTVVALCFLTISLYGVHVSHRVAGPLYCLGLAFEEIRQGRIPAPIRLRKGDYLRPEADTFNRMLLGLRTHLEEIQLSMTSLREDLDACQDSGRAAGGSSTAEVERLRSRADELESKLTSFMELPAVQSS